MNFPWVPRLRAFVVVAKVQDRGNRVLKQFASYPLGASWVVYLSSTRARFRGSVKSQTICFQSPQPFDHTLPHNSEGIHSMTEAQE